MAETSKPTEQRLYARVYSPTFLTRFYDFYVLRFNLRYIWRCPVDSVLLPFFSENFSRRHLDIGVATGWFPATALSRPFRAQAKHELTLVDLNPNPLYAAKSRVLSNSANTTVQCVTADVTAPLPEALQGAQFDSISMFNLFHCIPGPEKLRAFSIYKHLLADGGVLTGCTVLGGKHATNWLNWLYVKAYNRIGIFHNWDDNKDDFQNALEREFEEVETVVVGMLLLFRAQKPRRDIIP
ncbi:methyltransferase domain-containing protein [Whalleya microplaca]|nr:methyltransferase domain-containing protein [Whalleya microplaca]